MTCDFGYCIYNRSFKCILDRIEMDGSGQCPSCIMVSLPEKALERLKEKQLCDLEKRFENNL